MKKTVKKTQSKKAVAPFVAEMDKKTKVKIAQFIGLNVGKLPNGKDHYNNLFFEVREDVGTEVEMTSADLIKVRRAIKDFIAAQELLKKYLGA